MIMGTPSTQQHHQEEEQPDMVPSSAKDKMGPTTLHIGDRAALAAAWNGPHPILTHLNADTTWLLHLPYPEGAARRPGRSRFNVLLDPWLEGPQSDGGRWFSIQWHVVAPGVRTMAELNGLLGELEKGGRGTAVARDGSAGNDGDGGEEEEEEEEEEGPSYIDVVAISHEFTDHCHEATLRELPRATPVFAPDKAARLIRSWRHFDTVVEMPGFRAASFSSSPSPPPEGGNEANRGDWRAALSRAPLPPWVGVGRVVTTGNALYYHSAVVVAWGTAAAGERGAGDAVVYSPHGIEPEALEGLAASSDGDDSGGLRILALLHGLDDVRLWMTKQLNLGAVNGVAAARACGAKYWVATHDEVKKGGGFVSLLLRRTRWSVADAVRQEGRKTSGAVEEDVDGGRRAPAGYEFVELGSGDGLVLV